MAYSPKKQIRLIDSFTGLKDSNQTIKQHYPTNDLLKDLEASKGKTTETEHILQIPINLIKIESGNPRKNFDENKLKELAESIKATEGLLQPIGVRKTVDGYTLIYGERRLRAYIINKETKIPAVVKNVKQIPPELIPEIKLIENLQREDLSDFEIALSLTILKERKNLSLNELRIHVHKSLSWVRQKLLHATLVEEITKEDNTEETLSIIEKVPTTVFVNLQPAFKKDKKSVLDWLKPKIRQGNYPRIEEIKEFSENIDANVSTELYIKKNNKISNVLNEESIKSKIIKINKKIKKLKEEKKLLEEKLNKL